MAHHVSHGNRTSWIEKIGNPYTRNRLSDGLQHNFRNIFAMAGTSCGLRRSMALDSIFFMPTVHGAE